MRDKSDESPDPFADVRERATARLRKKFPGVGTETAAERIHEADDLAELSRGEISTLIHELQVYQLELELQSEALRDAQFELDKERDKYFALYNFAPVAYLTLDPRGIIHEVNLTAAKMLGEERQRLVGIPLSAFLRPVDVEAFHLHLREAWESRAKETSSVHMTRKDGTEFFARLETVAPPPEGSEEPRLQTAVSDITELKQSQEALEVSQRLLEQRVERRTAELSQTTEHLRQEVERHKRTLEKLSSSEARFRAVLEGVPDLIFVKDTEGRLTHVNSAVCRLMNMSADDLIGKRAEDFFAAETARQIHDLDRRVLGEEAMEIEHSRPILGHLRTFLDTRAPLYDDSGEIIGICVISRDITERKQLFAVPRTQVEQYPSPAMQETLNLARHWASKDSTVLLLGESGVGKDWLAKWIHDHSPRATNAFFAINCASLPAEMAESELFGHERGSFTGAVARKRGLVELAEGGTLLLNEIGELSLPLQAKLLTFLDTRTFLRVGGEKTIRVNARIMAATHRDLEKEVAEGRFLKPLFYRISVLTVTIPPLRDRLEDLPVLVQQLIDELTSQMASPDVPATDAASMHRLSRYDWPGNIRELRNVIERSLILSKGGQISLNPPPESVHDAESFPRIYLGPHETLAEAKDELIRTMCEEALRRCRGNKKEAARSLGISRDAFYRHLRRYDIVG